MDSWIGALLVLLVTALSSWLQKRSQAQQSEADEPRPLPKPPKTPSRIPQPRETAPPPAQPRRRSSWEEELRRLLEGETSPEPAEAPVIIRKSESPPTPSTPPVISAPAPTLVQEQSAVRGQKLADAEAAYAKARQLHQETARRLQEVVAHTKQHRGGPEQRFSPNAPEALPAITLLRDRHGVRQAIIASIILGPPRGLEEELGNWPSAA